ncbi:MAG: hypothetical protein E6Q50_17405 [Lysobacter sp.]|nr:MAG: hypothetical protein E6Q50_17405 [Lysobacter sp.]
MITDIALTTLIALAIFVCTNWIGKHSYQSGYFEIGKLSLTSGPSFFNFSYRIFTPIAFLTITSAIFYQINAGELIRLLPYSLAEYFVFRIAFNLIFDRILLINFAEFFTISAATFIIYLWIHNNIIEHKEFLFPSRQEIGSALWLGLAAFLYTTINNISLSEKKARHRRERYVAYQHAKYMSLFGKTIKEIAKNDRELSIVLAVLIYEGLNRPRIFQFLERLLLSIKGKATIGPMQVLTTSRITNDESVKLGTEKLLSEYRSAMKIEKREAFALHKALSAYNGSDAYAFEVSEILDILSPRKDRAA